MKKKKMTKYELSNRAHKRLRDYHANKYNDTYSHENWIKYGYHREVLDKQEFKGSRLSKDEKKSIFINKRENAPW